MPLPPNVYIFSVCIPKVTQLPPLINQSHEMCATRFNKFSCGHINLDFKDLDFKAPDLDEACEHRIEVQRILNKGRHDFDDRDDARLDNELALCRAHGLGSRSIEREVEGKCDECKGREENKQVSKDGMKKLAVETEAQGVDGRF